MNKDFYIFPLFDLSVLDFYQHLQIDVGMLHLITATAIQGNGISYNPQRVTKFKLHYSTDGNKFWRPYREQNMLKVISYSSG